MPQVAFVAVRPQAANSESKRADMEKPDWRRPVVKALLEAMQFVRRDVPAPYYLLRSGYSVAGRAHRRCCTAYCLRERPSHNIAKIAIGGHMPIPATSFMAPSMATRITFHPEINIKPKSSTPIT